MKKEVLSMTIQSTVVGEAGDVKAKFTLEYFNLDYKNVVMLEQKLVDMAQTLVDLGKADSVVEKK